MGAPLDGARESAFGSTNGFGGSEAGRSGDDWTEEEEGCVDGPARGIPSRLRSNERGDVGANAGV